MLRRKVFPSGHPIVVNHTENIRPFLTVLCRMYPSLGLYPGCCPSDQRRYFRHPGVISAHQLRPSRTGKSGPEKHTGGERWLQNPFANQGESVISGQV